MGRGFVLIVPCVKSNIHYPTSADKNYYLSMDDIEDWEEKIDVFAVCKKGNRTEQEILREHNCILVRKEGH